MQRYFSDMTDMGQLYINYPMIESYLHLKEQNDPEYLEHKVDANLQVLREYKRTVEKSVLRYTFEFPKRLYGSLMIRFRKVNANPCDICCEKICNISDASDIVNELRGILENSIAHDDLEPFLPALSQRIKRAGYAYNGECYWEHVRNLFKRIIAQNIWRANYIQSNQHEIDDSQYKTCFEQLDLVKILQVQNTSSRDTVTGFIRVLNTCVFIIAEYNFKLVL